MWEFYLSGSEASFRWQDLINFQIQLTRNNDALPITRDYITKCEKALEMHERAHGKQVAEDRPEQVKAPRPRNRKIAGKP
jgi:cyclopropane-fatty-acyl-phospholipid synthase